MDNKTITTVNPSITKFGGTNKRKTSKTSKSSKSIDERLSISPEFEPFQVQAVPERENYRETLTDYFFNALFEEMVVSSKYIRPVKRSSTDVSSDSLSSNSQGKCSELDAVKGTDSVTQSDNTRRLSQSSGKSTQFEDEKRQSAEDDDIHDCSSDCWCCWRVDFANGNYYQGQLYENMMAGRGEFHWDDGTIYKGSFKGGYPHGKGNITLPDLSTYEGDFSMGFFHGQGILNVKVSPIFYRGEWKIGDIHGKGWMIYGENDSYEGEFQKNMKQGLGYRIYNNGTRYKGYFCDNIINGEGKMFWKNNDYYTGEWSNGYQNGYGEYIWNLVPHKGLVFANYNWYKGNWIQGMRCGAGIMSFGHESGARMAGTWEYNKKHGAGLVFCGNGITIESNPLFLNDKPCTFKKSNADSYPEHDNTNKNDIETPNINPSQIYKDISKQIQSKASLSSLNRTSVMDITKSASTIKPSQYLKLLHTNTANNPPLKIPLHNIVEDLDFSFFIENVFIETVYPKSSDMSQLEIQNLMNCKLGSENLGVSVSRINYFSSNQDICFNYEESKQIQVADLNPQELRNLIILYLPQLRAIYRKYASLGVPEETLPFEPILVRFFLWQLYRDIGVTQKGSLSIIEVDEVLAKNPKSCLESIHDPWEPIYFWQFLQSLVNICFLLFNTNMAIDFLSTDRLLYKIFKQFLDHILLPRAGTIQGNCLTHLKDLVPINCIYELYKGIGEPHTVETFLRNVYLEKRTKVPCYKIINNEENWYTIQTGTNVVGLNNRLYFSKTTEEKVTIEASHDQIKINTLYTFSDLGKRRILTTISKICPQIQTDTRRYLTNYQLSFLEFFEIILLLTYEKVEQARLDKCKEATKLSVGMVEVKSFRDSSKLSQNDKSNIKLRKKQKMKS